MSKDKSQPFCLIALEQYEQMQDYIKKNGFANMTLFAGFDGIYVFELAYHSFDDEQRTRYIRRITPQPHYLLVYKDKFRITTEMEAKEFLQTSNAFACRFVKSKFNDNN